MKIYTITLNPAYDVHAYTDQFLPCHENLAQVMSRDVGGKGLNISRALKNAGIAHKTVVILGKENGGEFYDALAASGLDCIYFEKEGRIRENLTLHCGNGEETRISFSGFTLDGKILEQIGRVLEVDAETILTFTGRVPDGLSMAEVKGFLIKLREQGAKIVIDSKSFSLKDLLEIQPWLIKPNQEEIAEYLDCQVENLEVAVEKAGVFAQGGIANVMISLGEQGTVLHTAGQNYIAYPPSITAISTIGAGDSTVAGFLAGTISRKDPEECLRAAVSFGTAACLTQGSQPPQKAEIDAIYKKTKVVSI